MGGSVLVIDDEFGVRESIRMLLEPVYEVRGADGIRSGLAAIRARRPDLVLLDLAMPGGSGFDVLEQLRETPDPPPVIVITARSNPRTGVAAVAAGARDLLVKPFEPSELRARIGAEIEARSGAAPDFRNA